MEGRTKKTRGKKKGKVEENKNLEGGRRNCWYTIQDLYSTLLSEVSICEPLK